MVSATPSWLQGVPIPIPILRNSLISKARNTTSLVLKREGTDLKTLEVESGDGRGEGRAVGSLQAPPDGGGWTTAPGSLLWNCF